MLLKRLQFNEHKGEGNEWIFNETEFGQVNLIIGKNSTGKTRLLNVIRGLSTLLLGKADNRFVSADYSVTFEKGKDTCIYQLAIKNKNIVSEEFYLNGEKLLDRSEKGTSTVYASELDKHIKFQAPETKLAAYIKRDAIQHPYFEILYEWANSVKHYLFGSEFGKNNLYRSDSFNKNVSNNLIDDIDTDKVAIRFQHSFEKYGEKYKEAIKKDLLYIGYDISDIGIANVSGLVGQDTTILSLFVKENSLQTITSQITMSQGMYRAVALFVQLHATIFSQKSSCILLDDIGEGLDYERSSLLIECLIERSKENGFQLFMTTNDRFIMNNIPINYWVILERNAGVVSATTILTDPKVFDEFKYIGLNNFEFFSTGFYKSGMNE